jgi:hypothetical protein
MIARLKLLLCLSLTAVLITATMLYAAEYFNGHVVNVGDDTIVLSVDAVQIVLAVDENTAVTVDGETATLLDVMPGFTATVSAEQQGTVWLAKSIAAQSPM